MARIGAASETKVLNPAAGDVRRLPNVVFADIKHPPEFREDVSNTGFR